MPFDLKQREIAQTHALLYQLFLMQMHLCTCPKMILFYSIYHGSLSLMSCLTWTVWSVDCNAEWVLVGGTEAEIQDLSFPVHPCWRPTIFTATFSSLDVVKAWYLTYQCVMWGRLMFDAIHNLWPSCVALIVIFTDSNISSCIECNTIYANLFKATILLKQL